MAKRKGREQKKEDRKISVALAGNPNVGKSTLFNSLSGMHRHTGNWAGKTVSVATADLTYGDAAFTVADIPGTYSLLSHSEEEEIARNYICFGKADVTVLVLDATSLERSLCLALQVSEMTKDLIICLNLIDEAERYGIKIDTGALSRLLSAPVVCTNAKKKRSAAELLRVLSMYKSPENVNNSLYYSDEIEYAVGMVEKSLSGYDTEGVSKRWIALRLIESDADLCAEIEKNLGISVLSGAILEASEAAREYLFRRGIDQDTVRDCIVGSIAERAETVANSVCTRDGAKRAGLTERIDKVLTGRFFAFPVMLFLLFLVLFITLSLANYPSAALSRLFSYIEGHFYSLLSFCRVPTVIKDALVYGVYRTLSAVVAVMLPPMAIFFPMFTLLEDSGYLPRVAYNLDRPFAVCGACGKQALTMCMGLGCNAVGICGARIIDSKRERLLAILTNSLTPCNGKLPMLLSVISASFIMLSGADAPPYLSALLLLLIIIISTLAVFLVTFILSKTLLRGEKSSFTIELPPYRRPEVIRVILRSLGSKVLSVLLRAVAVAAPMGLIIYILANLTVGSESILEHLSGFLSPIGKIMGLDGKVLLAFILGLPANEIIIPILIMLYSGGGLEFEYGAKTLSDLFSYGGFGVTGCVCMLIFALFHAPCSTSVITVYKETRSIKYTALSVLIPTLIGFLLCVSVNLLMSLFGL